MTSRSSTSRSEIADRGARVPVDHVVVAVDQALLVERDEDLQHRADVGLVEREALLGVVARRAEALELVDDRVAVLLAPAPHALDERLAADLLAARALGLQQLLDLRLRRDAGVVGAEDPLRPLAAHAGVADQRVLDRPVERVPHVQRAGDVRRRDRDRVVLGRRALGLGVEATGLEPAREDARLALAGVVARAVLERPSGGESRTPVTRDARDARAASRRTRAARQQPGRRATGRADCGRARPRRRRPRDGTRRGRPPLARRGHRQVGRRPPAHPDTTKPTVWPASSRR